METRSFKGILLSTLMMVSIVAPAILILSPGPVHAASTPHAPIYIDGNDNFTLSNGVTSGSGTESDPYIIENWIMIENYNVAGSHGIKIENTSAYFVIRNCVIDGGLVGYDADGTAELNLATDSQGLTLYEWLLYRSNICLNRVSNGKVENCVVRNREAGIYLCESSDSTISGNTCLNCGCGILTLGSNNAILGNTCLKNNAGIKVDGSSGNSIFFNKCENNKCGISLSFSENNRICHNNFINNQEKQAEDGGINYWDDGYPSGGNYWGDYTGKDADGDGIGDTPYSILGDNNQDRYPLMKPFDEAPSGEMNWPLVAGITGIIAIIGAVAFYMRRR